MLLAKRKAFLWSALAIVTIASRSHASSPDAWMEFQVDVEKACGAKATAQGLGDLQIVVNPLGSESYGVAIVRGKDGPDAGIYACIYDKKTKRAEVTAGFDKALPRP